MRFRTGDFVLDPLSRRLSREVAGASADVSVEPRVFDALLFLIHHRDRVVGKEELIQTVWQGDAVTDDTLFKAIQGARQALGDSGKKQHSIRTVPRRGYQFVAPCQEEPRQGDQRDDTGKVVRGSRRIPMGLALALCAVVLAGVGWLAMARRGLDMSHSSSQPTIAGVNRSAQALFNSAERLLDLEEIEPGIEALREALALAPEFAVARSVLARALARLGREQEAAREAQTAFEQTEQLSRREQLRVESTYYSLHGQLAKAIDRAQALWLLHPDISRYGLELVELLHSHGETGAAREKLDEIGKLQLKGALELRRLLLDAENYEASGDLLAALQAGELAQTLARQLGSRRGQIRALLQQGDALVFLDEHEQALGRSRQAFDLSMSLGPEDDQARALYLMATAEVMLHDLDAAYLHAGQALEIHRRRGSKSGEVRVLYTLSQIDYERGRLKEADERLTQGITLARQSGEKKVAATLLKVRGDILADRGLLDRAEAQYLEAREILLPLNNPYRLASLDLSLGVLYQMRNDLVGSRRHYNLALTAFQELDAPDGVFDVLFNLVGLAHRRCELAEATAWLTRMQSLAGDDPSQRAAVLHLEAKNALEQGDLTRAERTGQEALRLRLPLGNQAEIAQTRLSLAAVLLAQGRAMQSMAMLHHIREEELARQSSVLELEVLLAEAEALLAQSQVAVALARLDLNEAQGARLPESSSQVDWLRLRAEAELAGGQPGQAGRTIAQALTQAEKESDLPSLLRVRLVQARIQRRLGQEHEMPRIAQDAQRMGCVRIQQMALEELAAMEPEGAIRLRPRL